MKFIFTDIKCSFVVYNVSNICKNIKHGLMPKQFTIQRCFYHATCKTYNH